jgi:glycosyltransferase involved in cell wall biosynthesis
MRVLFLSNEHGLIRTGSAYALRLERLGCAIEGHGIQTDFVNLREQPVGGPILAHPLNVPLIQRKLARYDFIHAGGNAAYTAVFLNLYTRAQVIHDVHGDTVSEAQLKREIRNSPGRIYRLLQAWVADAIAYRYADYCLAVSMPLRERLMRERHIPEHKIGLVRNGVDLKLFNQSSYVPEGRFTVGYAGGFQRWQGLDNLIAAFKLLSEDCVRLKIIGFTEQQAALRASIAGHLGNQVEMVDRVTQNELVSQLAGVHALIIPRSRHRAVEVAFPTKFAEYIALGKPIIVCDVDETARLVEQHHCGLVSEPNPTALAETIRAASRLDPAELGRMGQNARSLAEREFSWGHIGREYAQLLVKWSAKCGDELEPFAALKGKLRDDLPSTGTGGLS